MLCPGGNLQVTGSPCTLDVNYTSTICPALLLFIFIHPSSYCDLPIGSAGTNTSGLHVAHTQHTTTLLIMLHCLVSCLSQLFVYRYYIYFWEISLPQGLNYYGYSRLCVTVFFSCHLNNWFYPFIYSLIHSHM